MQCVILAGGLGTRISEESHLRPKPMIEIGGVPILWHIMKIYGAHGIYDFIICCGYKGYMIKEYFANYLMHMSDISIDMRSNSVKILHKNSEPWTVTLVDTGENTQTGGRIKRVSSYINGTFCLTYGDGLADVNITKLVQFHIKSKAKATVTAVQPDGRFGALTIVGNRVVCFEEKPKGDGHWINGGFFVCEMSVLDILEGDNSVWEDAPLKKLADDKNLSVFRHNGFWGAMDTLRDKENLEKLWQQEKAPWRVWD